MMQTLNSNILCNNQLVDTALLTQFLNEGLLRFVLFPFVNRKKIVIKQEYSKYVILACWGVGNMNEKNLRIGRYSAKIALFL